MKRGQSGLSLVVGVDKPSNMTSHDVVNICRGIFQEKRVGHTGTLDPLATGVLPICIGPATRLSSLITAEDKYYEARIAFGVATDTDDASGQVIQNSRMSVRLLDEEYARAVLAGLVGARMQLPPAYSAVKVQGKKSYEQARAGNIINLCPRAIEVFSADLISISTDANDLGTFSHDCLCAWNVAFHVSKGTYIRALARDLGKSLSGCAHLSGLRRTKAGCLSVHDCCSLEDLRALGTKAAIDPVCLLGLRVVYLDDADGIRAVNGGTLDAERTYFELLPAALRAACQCSSGVRESCECVVSGERISAVYNNKLVGVYTYDECAKVLKPNCVFREGIIRGSYL